MEILISIHFSHFCFQVLLILRQNNIRVNTITDEPTIQKIIIYTLKIESFNDSPMTINSMLNYHRSFSFVKVKLNSSNKLNLKTQY